MLKRSERGRLDKSKVSKSGGLGGLLFSFIWIAFSSIFVVVGLLGFFNEATSEFEEVPCLLEEFRITHRAADDKPFRAKVSYVYEIGGQEYRGDRLRKGDQAEDKYEELAKLREALLEAEETLTCSVNPADPSDSYLIVDAEQKWSGLVFAGFGLAFVLIGVGVLFHSIGQMRAKRKGALSETGQRAEMNGLALFGVFGAFALVGIAIFFAMVIPTGIRFFEAQSWDEAPAEVIWSRVRSNSSSDGTTYKPDIFYRYKYEGLSYRSNTYSLVGGSSSGRAGKQKVVNELKKGTKFTCFVNPEDPHEALVKRELGWWALIGLFPLPFMAIGLGGLYWLIFRREKGGKPILSSTTSRSPAGVSVSGGKLEESGSTIAGRWKTFLVTLAVALFWNGITSVFVVICVGEWSSGDGSWFLTLFLIPFVGIGLLLAVGIFHSLLGVFSPIYRVQFGDRRLQAGDETSVSWSRMGGGGHPRSLRVFLVGEEEAVYQRGSNTATDTSLFFEELIHEETRGMTMPSGGATLTIPANGVPSFRGKHNKIRWFFILAAEVPMRPDVRQSYEVDVLPPDRRRPK